LLTVGEGQFYALYTVLTAALVVGESLGEDLGQSLVRVVGTVLGAVIGIAAGLIAGNALWVVVIAAMLSLLISRAIKLEQLGRATVAVCLVTLLLHQNDVKDYAAYRLVNTLIGAAVGLGVSVFVWPVRAGDVSARLLKQLLDVSADLLDSVAGKLEPDKEPPQDVAVQHLAKAFKALKDARREEQWFFRVDPEHGESVILGSQIGVGAMSVSGGVSRLAKNPAAVPHFYGVRTVAGALADRARALADPEGKPVVPQSAIPDVPLPKPDEPGLNEVDHMLIAAVAGQLRVIAVALTVLERMATSHPHRGVTPPPLSNPGKSTTSSASSPPRAAP
jgi:hypothetical protein